MKTLLHACCGPCSLEPTRIYQEEQVPFAVYFSNSNIHPAEEYSRRLETLREHVAGPRCIEVLEDDYDPQAWEREVAVYGADRERRCRACYRLRFRRLAAAAEEQGFEAIGTTLTISPYQYTDVILEELAAAASEFGLASAGRDFSSCYGDATRISKQLGMYRQNYCGCRFSIAEAQQERNRRAELRQQEKAVKQAALLQAAAEGVVNQASQL